MITEAQSRLTDLNIPKYYSVYYNTILDAVQYTFNLASQARHKNFDVTNTVESKIAYDLADRVAKMHEIDIADRLRFLLTQVTKEKAALKIAEEIALGEYGTQDMQTRLDTAVRVSLAIVTEGVTVAPLQGISDVRVKLNADNSKYLSISFAGPIRSAGGTEAAFTMLIADHVRKAVGLETYVANSYDDEIGRFVEELRIYEREVGNFQFRIPDEDVIKCISLLPVELDGVDTDPVEVAGHRNMHRISTNRVRGGALRVMNDGLIGRSRKLLKIVQMLGIDGWTWLDQLNGAIQNGEEDDAIHHRMREVITGRPVLSMTGRRGGFRLRYGRSCNTGFATVGIHPSVPVLLKNAIVVGTQIKMDTPGKASTIALVDTIESPIVKLNDDSVIKITTSDHAYSILSKLKKILYLGDILISYGDFLENNSELLPASYVEEIWISELKSKLTNTNYISSYGTVSHDRIVQLLSNPFHEYPTIEEAFDISTHLNIPLHPKYLLYWDTITLQELIHLIKELYNHFSECKEDFSVMLDTLSNSNINKLILEKLAVIHRLNSNQSKIIITDTDHRYIFTKIVTTFYQKKDSLFLYLDQLIAQNKTADPNDNIQIIQKILNVPIKRKFFSSIAVRVGRPEKAAERRMKPPVHLLFPVGTKGGPTRDIIKTAEQSSTYIEIANRVCKDCQIPSIGVSCRLCHGPTQLKRLCIVCKRQSDDNNLSRRCTFCNNEYRTYSTINFPLKDAITKAFQSLNLKPIQPLKGVKLLMGKNRYAEPLEKGILRQKNTIFTFKDGTIRYDATNEPLTHFKPKWIMTSIERLKLLGYTKDHLGIELTSSEQLIELMIQDIIIPVQAAEHLLNVTKFIDDELTKFYGLSTFYNTLTINDLIGHLVVGLAPHTSVGIVGRIIGFTNSQVCLASPIWHSAKRRDCDGDADSLMLLMDIFLNFSREYLPNKIGGLMDAPLLIQPVVLPHEVQRQAHNVDISESYPIEFYHHTWNKGKAVDSISYIDLVKKRIGQLNQFFDYRFTHHTDSITLDTSRSSYSILNTMEEKLDMQMTTAKIIDAVDPDDVASMVLTTHILPDIMGNMRAYSSQSFRCNKCGKKYRRIPLAGKCLECNNSLLQTVTRASVQKYMQIALNLCDEFNINEYLVNRVKSLQLELNLLFRTQQKIQSSIMDFA
ncbi:MAG: DNA polymerase II large subunit [Thermoproteota archaeon]|nr:DNA polymerase II large subunit [Thermoproteota archaeon]